MTEPQRTQTARWLQLRAWFDQAIDLPDAAREELLRRVRLEDAVLADELQALLDAAVRDEDSDTHAAELRRRVLGEIAQFSAAAPQSAGAFEILEEIGRGGMGVVYRARRSDGVIEHDVAVKFLHAGAVVGAEQKRLLQECRTLSALDHPGIARILDAGSVADGRSYLAMELVRGEPLLAWCDAQKLDIRARVQLFLEVCAAVEHAHQRLVLHSDLKSSNVLVADGRPKLIDFGIARRLSLDGEATLTVSRHFSPTNVSPEQLRGERLGVACDVYQLGVLLYELLCGQRVHTAGADNLEALRHAVIEEIPARPSQRALQAEGEMLSARGLQTGRQLAAELDGDLDAIVMMCLRKPAAERYASVEALSNDLRACLALEPVRASGGQNWYRLRRFVQRNRLPVALGGLAVSALIAFAAMAWFHVQRIEAAQARADTERDAAEQVTAFMVEAFRSADPNHSLRPDTSVGEVLARARQLLDTQDLAAEPKVRMLKALAEAHHGTSDLVTALELLNRAEAILVAGNADAREHADLLAQKARVHFDASRHVEADASARRSLELLRSAGATIGEELPMRVLQIRSRGHTEGTDRAGELAEALLREVSGIPGLPLRSQTELELEVAIHLRRSNRAEAALALVESTVARLAAAGEPYRLDRLLAELRLADILEYPLGRLDDSLAVVEGVLQQLPELLGENTATMARAYMVKGNTLTAMDDWDRAISAYQTAVDIYDRIYVEPNASHVAPYINIGIAHHNAKRLRDALRAMQIAHERAQRAPEALSYMNHHTARHVADMHVELGDWAEAKDMYLSIPEDSPNSGRAMLRRAIGLTRAYAGLGDVPRARERYATVVTMMGSKEEEADWLLDLVSTAGKELEAAEARLASDRSR